MVAMLSKEGDEKAEQNLLYNKTGMLPKKNRVGKKAIEEIFKSGKFINSANLTLKYIGNLGLGNPQVSFIVPKTVTKKAVIRNLLRRRGYFVLKKYLSRVPNGFSGVIIFNKKAVEIFGGRKNKLKNPIENLDNEIKTILNKIN